MWQHNAENLMESHLSLPLVQTEINRKQQQQHFIQDNPGQLVPERTQQKN